MKPIFLGMIAGILLAVLLRKIGVVTASGAWAGALLVTAFYGIGGEVMFGGFALLVILGTLASSFGKKEKRERGLARPRESKRNAGQALANGGPALILLLLFDDGARIAALGALAGALADTASSEIGMLARRRPRLLLVGPEVATGRDGGMTWFGLGAGVLASMAHGVIAAGEPHGLLAASAVLLGALCGQLCDSLLGATVEGFLPKAFANDLVNALSSLVAGLVAWICFVGWIA